MSGVESMQHIQELLKKEGMPVEQIYCHVPENAKDWNEALMNYAKDVYKRQYQKQINVCSKAVYKNNA